MGEQTSTNMKQVWMLNHYAKAPGEAGGTRHFHLAQHLLNQGWNTTIIASAFVTDSDREPLKVGENGKLELRDGVPFLWVKTAAYSGNGSGRMLNMLTYTWQVLKHATTKDLPKPDVIIGSSVHPFAALAGALLAKRRKVPFIFEVRDLWPQTLIDMGRLQEKSLVTWVLRKLERWLYRRADRIIVLLPKAWEYIEPLGIERERVVWIPNGVEMALYPSQPAQEETSEEESGFTFMYFGAHGQANGLDNVLQAMWLVQEQSTDKNITLRLIGDGPLKPVLIEQAEKMGLSNVQFEEAVPKNMIPSLAAQADAFVISVLDLPKLYRFGISMNKLFDYLAAAKPIIISSSAANNPVEESSGGITIAPDNPKALADAIVRLSGMPLSVRQEMGRNGRSYVEKNHSFECLAKKLATELDAACAERNQEETHKR